MNTAFPYLESTSNGEKKAFPLLASALSSLNPIRLFYRIALALNNSSLKLEQAHHAFIPTNPGVIDV